MSSIPAQATQAGAEAWNAVPNRPKTNLQGVGAAGGLRAPGASGSLGVDVQASDMIDGEKFCPRCGESWPADTEFFFANRQHPDGLWNYCKACFYEQTRPNAVRRKLPVTPAAQRPTDVLADRLALSWVEARP